MKATVLHTHNKEFKILSISIYLSWIHLINSKFVFGFTGEQRSHASLFIKSIFNKLLFFKILLSLDQKRALIPGKRISLCKY